MEKKRERRQSKLATNGLISVNEPGSYTQVTLLISSTVEIRMLIKAEVGMCCGRSNFGISIAGQAWESSS